jgi:hypothetical protein
MNIVYSMFMPKKGVSVTLDGTNLLWLKSRTVATKARSLSETLDSLVTAARTGGTMPAVASRSVAGTVDIADDDPNLDRADAYVRQLVDASLSKPMVARESPPPCRAGKSRGPRRG